MISRRGTWEYPEAQLREFIARGFVTADTLVWAEDMADWRRADEIPNLFSGTRRPPTIPRSVAPLPIEDPADNEPPPITNENEWYYNENGARKGPVSAAAIKELLAKKQLDSTDQVWRRGMKEWQAIRDSDLGTLVSAEPPPLSGAQVSNTLVWIVAFIPMIFGIIDLAFASDPSVSLARTISNAGGLPWKEREVPVLVYTAVYGLLCIWDEFRLEKAGYTKGYGMRFLAIFIVPVYLFVRAKKVKQRPTYAITWVVLFVLFAILVAAAQS